MSLIVAEYECPVHGRFELIVERDANGDAPDGVECSASIEIIIDSGRPRWFEQPCRQRSPWVISAPMGRVSPFSMVRGKSDARPADRHVMDTSVLADGMSMTEFKSRRAKVHRDESLRRVRKAFGRGPKTYVGGK